MMTATIVKLDASPDRHDARGFTLVELLVAMAITTVILGTTMAAMNDAIKATDSAKQVTDLNNGLRTAMDMMVRDMLQVGQGLPPGRVIGLPSGAGLGADQLPGPIGSNIPARRRRRSVRRIRTTRRPTRVCEQITAVVPGPGRGPQLGDGGPRPT